MTTLVSRPAEDRLRTTLLVDAVVVGLSGVLLATTPSSWYGDLPGWLVRVAGVVLALVSAEVGLMSRWHDRRLRLAATAIADLAFVWTALMVIAVELGDVRGAGLETLALSGLATLVFGILETSLVRALR
jgi:hypothetical protein